MKYYLINEFISLRLEDDETVIYVKDEKFIQCKNLVVKINTSNVAFYDSIESIDDIHSNEIVGDEDRSSAIPPEVEFWGHCSNLQAWAEHNYDTRLIHSNLAFPLLKKLIEMGDPYAKKIFKNELFKKFLSKNKNTIYFLLEEGYLEQFNNEELETLIIKAIEIKNPLINILECYYGFDSEKYKTVLKVFQKVKSDIIRKNQYGMYVSVFEKINQKFCPICLNENYPMYAKNGQIFLFNYSNNEEQIFNKSSREKVISLFRFSQNKLITLFENGNIEIKDIGEGNILKSIKGLGIWAILPPTRDYLLGYSSKLKRKVSGLMGREFVIYVWRLNSFEAVFKSELIQDIEKISIAQNKSLIAYKTLKEIIIYNFKTNKKLKVLKSEKKCTAIEFLNDKILAYASEEEIHLISLESEIKANINLKEVDSHNKILFMSTTFRNNLIALAIGHSTAEKIIVLNWEDETIEQIIEIPHKTNLTEMLQINAEKNGKTLQVVFCNGFKIWKKI